MTGKKLYKVLLVWLCIITLVMPFATEVLAAALTSESTTAVLESVPYREGGAESTGLTSDKYDENAYAYKVSGVNVLKITQKDDFSFSDTFYCVNAELSLSITDSYNYKKVANDFKLISDSEVKKWADSVGISTENYNSLIYLLENIYLKKQDTSYKDTYIAKAFAELIEEEADYTPPTTVELIKTYLTDDDIDVVQQWAIWYFTNGTNDTNAYYNSLYKALGAIEVSYASLNNGTIETKTEDLSSTRQRYAGILFNYLVTSAKDAAKNPSNGTRPSIDKTVIPTSTVDGKYYKVGPFKVNSGTTIPADFSLTLTAEGGDLSTVGYKIYVDGAETNVPFNQIFDKDYYVYIPIENNTITSIKLSSSMGARNISLWQGEHDVQTLQPVILITNEPTKDEIIGRIEPKQYDLALRKFIVSVNGEAVQGREPIPTTDSLQKLAAGTVDTAEYTHSKNPVPVKKGDRIVYEFRIYNEGDLDATVQKIADYLPAGLTIVDKSVSPVNSKYNWEQDGTTLNNTYLSNTTIPAFDKTNLKLSYGTIQLECEITGDLSQGTTLTNVAEIIVNDGNDKDSTPGSINKSTITEGFTGNTSNKDDLSDRNYHYKGIEDDDDFEKLIIEGKQFDLNLKKFVSKVNEEALTREPKVDVTPLNNGKNDASYTTNKTPVDVKTGDIITFTLRVYNEGDIAGYAEQIMDYIPEGLGFLVNYNTNYNNRWAISSDAKSVKLSTVTDGMKNLKISDFTDVDKLEDVEVVLGKTKVTSTALSSSATSSTNLINAFDGNNLSYKDIQISCIVVTEDELTLKNIAAITGASDENRDPVDDRDSTPVDDIDPDKYTTGNEDDDDYDVVKTDKKDFDLSLQKFITALNNEEITNRVPTITKDENGELHYTHSTDPLTVGNGDLITYTIRVYNEGQIDGYAAEISDTIPNGLTFVTENDINKQYGWKMYDKDGKETIDVNQAVSVRTTYLSKENSEDNLIKAFDKNSDISSSNPDYKDVKLVFRVDEAKLNKTINTAERTLINIAEIFKNTDKDGNDIPDKDSTPGNGDPDEDDLDKEQVYVKYFDLALDKKLTKALVTVDGKTTELNVAPGDETIKVEVNRKKITSTSIKFIYNITVRNEGEIEGYATEVTDYIPEGLSFNKADNLDWEQVSARVITSNALAKTLLKPGESATIPVVLTWEEKEGNVGKFVNIAEISDDWNPYDSDDVDSTPNNKVPTEDDYDEAPVYVSIITGLTDRPYILLTSVVLLILGTGIVLIKKYVL